MNPLTVIDVIDDPAKIARFAQKELGLHLYEIGDLDPFFFPSTTYYGTNDATNELTALALVYRGSAPPTLLALGREGDAALTSLFRGLLPKVRHAVYAHLAPGLADLVVDRKKHDHGRFVKMRQVEREALALDGSWDAVRLAPADLDEVRALYAASYPGNWFDPRMLETGQYFGIRDGGALVSVAGVHVFSREHGVAALGNVTTSPAYRKKGYAARVTARLCQSLLDDGIFMIGLNVKADNGAAIACYEKLGFATVAPYEEWSFDPP